MFDFLTCCALGPALWAISFGIGLADNNLLWGGFVALLALVGVAFVSERVRRRAS